MLFQLRAALPVLFTLVWALPAAALSSLAVWYGDHPPLRELAQFERIVIEAEHLAPGDLVQLQRYGSRVYAYVSVGEAEPWRADYGRMDRAWFLGRNTAWGSDIADLANPAYRRFLLEHRFEPLWQQGFRAFFCDTLDSYQALDTDGTAQQQGLIALVRELRARHPEVRLLFNRGFEVVPQLRDALDGVAAESLLRRWNPATQVYEEVPAADRTWLLEALTRVRDSEKLDVFAIDYVPAAQRELARQTAQQIAELGISPWVTVPEHDLLGVGVREVLPRQVLVLYDRDTDISVVERLLGVVLDYYGYIPVYRQVGEDLPPFRLAGRFAGLVSWLHRPTEADYVHWLKRQADDGLRLLLLPHPGADENDALLSRFGLTTVRVASPLQVVDDGAKGYGYELRQDRLLADLLAPVNARADNQVLLRATDRQGTVFTPVVTGPWGGVALLPWVIYDVQAMPRWIFDPFLLVRTALNLPDVPMPDITTENGQRLWMSHIDGDGFPSRAEFPGTPYAPEIIRTRILEKYRLPQSVSIIEGEIGPAGMHPELSPELEPLARAIFRLPTVELATHTYSHPFDWEEIREGEVANDDYSLPIPGYRYSLQREILGSVDYIQQRLAPSGKKVALVFWSGNCLPTEEALRLTREAGLLNINGGETTIRNSHPYLSEVTPATRPVGAELQVYAPIMNENVYTNLWTGPFYGFRRVIETLQLTDRPRRLKPIDIYYHFYSGAKVASLRALDEVYRWSLNQEVVPVFISDYIRRVQAYQQATVARDLDGTLHYQAPGDLRSLRRVGGASPGTDPVPGTNVAGVRRLHDGTYYALGGDTRSSLRPAGVALPGPLLVRSNGVLTAWQRQGRRVRLSLRGYRPLELVVQGAGTCRLQQGSTRWPGEKTAEGWRFALETIRLEGGVIDCR